jgi:hypothetical protein
MPGLDPGIHDFGAKTWMAGTSSAKTRFALLPGYDEFRGIAGHISLSFPDFGAKSPPTPQPPHPWRLAVEYAIGRG